MVLVHGFRQRQLLLIVREQPQHLRQVLARLGLVLMTARMKVAGDGLNAEIDVSVETTIIHASLLASCT